MNSAALKRRAGMIHKADHGRGDGNRPSHYLIRLSHDDINRQ